MKTSKTRVADEQPACQVKRAESHGRVAGIRTIVPGQSDDSWPVGWTEALCAHARER